jgi:hypothetical protein
MKIINLRVYVGSKVDSDWDYENAEDRSLIPEGYDDDSAIRRRVAFANKDVCDVCEHADSCDGIPFCQRLLNEIPLTDGSTQPLPQTMSDKFLRQGVTSFGKDGAIINLFYEQLDDPSLL